MAKLPENIYVPVEHKQETAAQIMRKKLSDLSLDNFAFTEKDGKIYQNHKKTSKDGFLESELVEVEKENPPLVKDYLKVKKSVDNIMNAETTEGTTDKKFSELRQTLTQNYNNFTKNHGYLNSPKNIQALGSDPNYRRVMAIENYKAEKSL